MLSAFECSHLAGAQADSSRLFTAGLNAGRAFLTFSEQNPTGYRSLEPQIDPVWTSVAARPSVDFKLGELYATTVGRIYDYRGRLGDDAWQHRRDELYAEKNCALVDAAPSK